MLGVLCACSADQEIDGEAFLDLTESDIKLLTDKLGLVKKLLRVVCEVSSVSSVHKCLIYMQVESTIYGRNIGLPSMHQFRKPCDRC